MAVIKTLTDENNNQVLPVTVLEGVIDSKTNKNTKQLLEDLELEINSRIPVFGNIIEDDEIFVIPTTPPEETGEVAFLNSTKQFVYSFGGYYYAQWSQQSEYMENESEPISNKIFKCKNDNKHYIYNNSSLNVLKDYTDIEQQLNEIKERQNIWLDNAVMDSVELLQENSESCVISFDKPNLKITLSFSNINEKASWGWYLLNSLSDKLPFKLKGTFNEIGYYDFGQIYLNNEGGIITLPEDWAHPNIEQYEAKISAPIILKPSQTLTINIMLNPYQQ